MYPNKISTLRSEESAKKRLTDLIINNDSSMSRIFHFGQVIDSDDPEDANRLRIRIPLMDDIFYTNDEGELEDGLGDDVLPWAVPSSSRTINTPENGSVVTVAVFDPKVPMLGRMWFDTVPELGEGDLFDAERLAEELQSDTDRWENVESAVGTKFDNTPEVRNREGFKSQSGSINYETGIRGKDKNTLLFEQGQTTLVQNKGKENESKLELTEDVLLTGKNLKLVSSQKQSTETPLFASPMFQYLTQLNTTIQSMLTIMNTVPSLLYGTVPNVANPGTASIMSQFGQVQQKLADLQTPGNGHSQYIKIN